MTFEQMGVDALFIDEAHNYKKIGFPSKMSNVKGIDTSASQRANSMLLKAQWISENNGGRNVVLATGTPITNTCLLYTSRKDLCTLGVSREIRPLFPITDRIGWSR